MFKMKVEWYQTCPDCGTQLVVDFLADALGCRVCPWCECALAPPPCVGDDELIDFLSHSVGQLETVANGKLPVQR